MLSYLDIKAHVKGRVGIRARADIERALAAKIFLGLHIKVSKEWQKDPKLLAKLGFGDKS